MQVRVLPGSFIIKESKGASLTVDVIPLQHGPSDMRLLFGFQRLRHGVMQKAVVYDADENPAHSEGAGSIRRWPDSSAAVHTHRRLCFGGCDERDLILTARNCRGRMKRGGTDNAAHASDPGCIDTEHAHRRREDRLRGCAPLVRAGLGLMHRSALAETSSVDHGGSEHARK